MREFRPAKFMKSTSAETDERDINDLVGFDTTHAG